MRGADRNGIASRRGDGFRLSARRALWLAAMLAGSIGGAQAACPTYNATAGFTGTFDTTGGRDFEYLLSTSIDFSATVLGEGIRFGVDQYIPTPEAVALSVTSTAGATSTAASSYAMDITGRGADICYTGAANLSAPAAPALSLTNRLAGAITAEITGGQVVGGYAGIEAWADTGNISIFVDSDALVVGSFVGILAFSRGNITITGAGASDTGSGIRGGSAVLGVIVAGGAGNIVIGTATARIGSLSAVDRGISAGNFGSKGNISIYTGDQITTGSTGSPSVGIDAETVAEGDVIVDTAGSISSDNGIEVVNASDATGDIVITTRAGTEISVNDDLGIGISASRFSSGSGIGNIQILNNAVIIAPVGGSAETVGIYADLCNCTRGDVSVVNTADITASVGIYAASSGTVSIQHMAGRIAADTYGIVGEGLDPNGFPTVPVSITVGAGASVVAPTGIHIGFPGLHKGNPSTIVIAGNVLSGAGTAIDLGSGLNTLEVHPGYVIEGAVLDNGAGDDSLVLGGPGTGSFNLSLLDLGGQLAAFEDLTKRGTSTWTLTADSGAFTSPLSIEAGKLVVAGDATYRGIISLSIGGILGGNGTIGGLVNGGTVAPGNSIGTLNVIGNATFASGSTYEVEVNPTQSDLVTAGTATLAGNVSVLLLPGAYAASQRYTIVSTAAGRAGTFAASTDNSIFFDTALSYDALNAYLTLFRNGTTVASLGLTPNQKATGAAMDAGVLGPYPAQFLILDRAAFPAALDALSGEIHAGLKGVLIADSHLRDAAFGRLQSAFAAPPAAGSANGYASPAATGGEMPGNAVWGHVYGGFGSIPSDGNAAALDHREAGLIAGADAMLGAWRLGLLAGYGQSAIAVPARGSTASATDFSLGLYGGGGLGPLGLKFGAAYTQHQLATRRTASFPGVLDTFTASYAAGTVQVFAEAAPHLELGAAAAEPFAGLALVNESNAGFTETGGAGALTVTPGSLDAAITTLGLRLEGQFVLGEATLVTARGAAAWRHVVAGTPTTSNGFAGGVPFTIAGAPVAVDALLLSAELDLNLSPTWDLDLVYRGELVPGAAAHSGTATVAAAF